MDLTPENRALIDGLSIRSLLERVRFGPVGDQWLQGETGDYWIKRLAELRETNQAAYIAASKSIGWDRR